MVSSHIFLPIPWVLWSLLGYVLHIFSGGAVLTYACCTFAVRDTTTTLDALAAEHTFKAEA